MIEKPGVYRISNEQYHSKDCCVDAVLSTSFIRDLLFECPARAWWNHPKLNPDFIADNGAGKYDCGSAAHDLLLEGGAAISVITGFDDWKKNDAKALREAARLEGKTPLLVKQYEEVAAMVSAAEIAIKNCKELGISNLRAEGDSELSYVWKEGDTWMKCRPDWLRKDRKLKLAYKTTGTSANPEILAKHILNMGYDISFAFYQRGIQAIEGTEPKTVFLFQECEAPYLCSFVSLPPEFIELAKSKVEYGIFLWNQCRESGQWPAYPSRVCYPDLPAWELARWEAIASSIGYGPEKETINPHERERS